MLTDKQCRALLKQAEQGELKSTHKAGDGQCLYLRGGRYWKMTYRFDGKQKELALGVYPKVPLEAARRARDEAQRLLTQGVDPMAARKELKAAARAEQEEASQTFEIVAREWHEKQEDKNTLGYWKDNLGKLEKHVFPVIGGIPVKKLDRAALIELLRPLYNRLDTAGKVCRLIKDIFDYAIDMTYTESNPAYRLNKTLPAKPPVKHSAYLKTETQIGLLCLRMKAYGGIPSTTYALKLALLMGDALRSSAFRNSQWGFIDFSQGTWTVPRSTMKRKTGDDYTVPLSRQALVLLEELYELEPHEATDLIFPGRDPGKILSENTLNNALRRMGYSKEELVFHGLRGTFSTWANYRWQEGDARFAPDLIEQALDHADRNHVRRSYNHADSMEARRKMLQVWADALDEMAGRAANSVPGKM